MIHSPADPGVISYSSADHKTSAAAFCLNLSTVHLPVLSSPQNILYLSLRRSLPSHSSCKIISRSDRNITNRYIFPVFNTRYRFMQSTVSSDQHQLHRIRTGCNLSGNPSRVSLSFGIICPVLNLLL